MHPLGFSRAQGVLDRECKESSYQGNETMLRRGTVAYGRWGQTEICVGSGLRSLCTWY
jgi:hypothetical protein